MHVPGARAGSVPSALAAAAHSEPQFLHCAAIARGEFLSGSPGLSESSSAGSRKDRRRHRRGELGAFGPITHPRMHIVRRGWGAGRAEAEASQGTLSCPHSAIRLGARPRRIPLTSLSLSFLVSITGLRTVPREAGKDAGRVCAERCIPGGVLPLPCALVKYFTAF